MHERYLSYIDDVELTTLKHWIITPVGLSLSHLSSNLVSRMQICQYRIYSVQIANIKTIDNSDVFKFFFYNGAAKMH